ncbi:MAG: FKBP-type peptidyl-prolyl cis-trans isomerase [Bacteroidales bacterium]|nr:FKBP-type peptidyl-prolyl cis-trans isomerase [Bacteroidales bacterium]
MARSIRIASALAAALLALSCGKESDKLTYSNQETRIEEFVKAQIRSNESAYTVSNNGSIRLVLTEGSGEELRKGGTISFYYAGYVMTGSSISSSNLFATNDESLAKAAGLPTEDGACEILTINLGETDLVEGLADGLLGVKGGEECIILFSGRHGYGNKNLGTIPAKSALAYRIWVESISND